MDSTFISLCFGHLILMAIALPLVMQKIKPNHLYGVRTAFTLSNKTVWYQANRFWGIAMIASGLAFFLLSALLGNWRADADEQHVSIALFLVTVLLPAVLTMGKLRCLKKE
ncbi:SdpI/YhfL family protein [Enterobacter sp. BIGb0383]|uniref:SdpI family protein n=1 Tax=unclassified Enterobacter TaxID=2608935 RepID=UPI000F49131A|nr:MULTISPECIES: SdpI family protein [unclassified Enterobacter]ROP59280.1 SdpI/YhfL family protein [Enterobacter sp. BIGb0383]ROS09254.1 SdpI/YhfL family protein [Enterobacter sp. BIGb0359]